MRVETSFLESDFYSEQSFNILSDILRIILKKYFYLHARANTFSRWEWIARLRILWSHRNNMQLYSVHRKVHTFSWRLSVCPSRHTTVCRATKRGFAGRFLAASRKMCVNLAVRELYHEVSLKSAVSLSSRRGNYRRQCRDCEQTGRCKFSKL